MYEINETINIIYELKNSAQPAVLYAVIMLILAAIGAYYTYKNYHKNPESTSKASQSVSNSSGVIQQNADKIIIGEQKITIHNKNGDGIDESIKLDLIEIDRQLTDLYKPMYNYIGEYIDVSATSDDPNILDKQKVELKRKLGELQVKYPDRVDIQVIKFSEQFFNGICPAEIFQDSVGIKIRSLQTEKENLMNKFKKKG